MSKKTTRRIAAAALALATLGMPATAAVAAPAPTSTQAPGSHETGVRAAKVTASITKTAGKKASSKATKRLVKAFTQSQKLARTAQSDFTRASAAAKRTHQAETLDAWEDAATEYHSRVDRGVATLDRASILFDRAVADSRKTAASRQIQAAQDLASRQIARSQDVGIAAMNADVAPMPGEGPDTSLPEGVSAIVGPVTIADLDVANQVLAVQQQRGDSPDPSDWLVSCSVLRRVILAQLLDVASTRNGVNVTDADIAAERAALARELGGEAGLKAAALAQDVPADQINAHIRTSLQAQALGKILDPSGDDIDRQAAVFTVISAISAELDVVVRQWYGTWSHTDLEIL